MGKFNDKKYRSIKESFTIKHIYNIDKKYIANKTSLISFYMK